MRCRRDDAMVDVRPLSPPVATHRPVPTSALCAPLTSLLPVAQVERFEQVVRRKNSPPLSVYFFRTPAGAFIERRNASAPLMERGLYLSRAFVHGRAAMVPSLLALTHGYSAPTAEAFLREARATLALHLRRGSGGLSALGRSARPTLRPTLSRPTHSETLATSRPRVCRFGCAVRVAGCERRKCCNSFACLVMRRSSGMLAAHS